MLNDRSSSVSNPISSNKFIRTSNANQVLEKGERDNLTPLDARQSILLETGSVKKAHADETGIYNYPSAYDSNRSSPGPDSKSRHESSESASTLVNSNDVGLARSPSRDSDHRSHSPIQHPRLPNLDRPY